MESALIFLRPQKVLSDSNNINTGEGRAAILEAAGVKDISELHKIPFWDAWGGKLVVLALLALILYGIFGREKKPKDANE